MKQILVATDYSKNAQNAIDYACELAKLTGAKLHIIHTFDIWIPVTEVPVATPPTKEIEEENNRKLTALSQKIKEQYNIEVGFSVSAGSLSFVLQEYINENKVDLLVMGMRGGGEFSKHLFGSNTISVIESNFCPVLVIPENYTFQLPKKLALAADLQKTEKEKYHILIALIKIFKAELQVFNVVEYNKLPQIKEAIEGVKLDEIFEGIPHDYFFPEAEEIIEGIDHFVHHKKPDWLAMVPREHGFFYRLIKEGTTEKIIYNSQIPVLALC